MRFPWSRTQIDAAAEIEQAQDRLAWGRGPFNSDLVRRARPAGVAGIIVVFVLFFGGLFWLIWWFGQSNVTAVGKSRDDGASFGQFINTPQAPQAPKPPEPEPTQPSEPQKTAWAPSLGVFDPDFGKTAFASQQQSHAEAPPPKTEEQILREQWLAPSFGSSSGGAGPASTPVVAVAPESSEDEYTKRLKPSRTPTAYARTSTDDPNLTIRAGTPIRCTLTRRIVAQQPGELGCLVSDPVFSDSTNVKLIDAGSTVRGIYRGGLMHGQSTIGAIFQTIQMTHGDIEIDSLGAGPMGEAGLPVATDSHFWERFGGAIMISLIDDLAGALANSQSRGDGNISFSNTASGAQQAATEALRNSVNIPPTGYKNEGDVITIIVARKLDFSRHYKLVSR